jgi:hypothetical protein
VWILYNGTVSDYYLNALSDALRRVAGSPLLAAAIDRVASSAAAIAAQLRQAVLAEVPEFSKSRNPDLLPELASHGREHVDEIVRLLRGGGIGRFDFVHEHARRRAEQRFPLEATLHAYRSGHKVLSRWLRESALTVASPAEDAQRAIAGIVDFSMEYTDAISTTLIPRIPCCSPMSRAISARNCCTSCSMVMTRRICAPHGSCATRVFSTNANHSVSRWRARWIPPKCSTRRVPAAWPIPSNKSLRNWPCVGSSIYTPTK